MKKLFLTILLLLSLQFCHSQYRANVDERFELTSIVFALAGVPEYCQIMIPSYLQDIRDQLTRYEMTHPINYIRELNQIHGIGYDAVSTTAAMLEIKNGKICLQPQYEITKISEIDSRWNDKLFTKYLKMLNVFYKQSNFHQFFLEHKDLYRTAEEGADEVLRGTISTWFDSFYGNGIDETFKFYLSLCNGPCNYSLPSGGILIGMQTDEDGLPSLDISGGMFLVIHELSHLFTNPIIEVHWHEMEDAANKFYPYVKDMMELNAYGNAKIAFGEGLNNLFTIMYIKDTDQHKEDMEFLLYGLVEKGFIWLPRCVEFMDNFYAHRDRYPHIADFMPQLIAFLNYTADQYDVVIDEFENRCPTITSVYPSVGSDISEYDEIVVTFSKPMRGSCGFYGIDSDNGSVKQLPYDFANVKWLENKLQLVIPIQTDKIEKGCKYGIQLFPKAIKSASYYWLDDRCKNLIFNTGI